VDSSDPSQANFWLTEIILKERSTIFGGNIKKHLFLYIYAIMTTVWGGTRGQSAWIPNYAF